MSRAYHPSQTQNQDGSLSAILSHLQPDDRQQPLDGGRASGYQHTGLTPPHAELRARHSEPSPAVQYQAGQDYKPSNSNSNYSQSATPTSEYGASRSGSFPNHAQPNRYSTASHAGMAQTSSPSLSMLSSDAAANGGHTSRDTHSDGNIPIDPSIAQASPTYPPPHNHSPYPPQYEMPQYAGQPVYGRPEWAGPYQQPMYGHSPVTSGPGGAPNMSAQAMSRPPAVRVAPPMQWSKLETTADRTQGGHPLSTVYSFVPIPGAQQHKRPRRRYEEIERMYKCGWNGCEKAYGTLNHLNAHVTMQSHGTKRTPEEIRKEWKAKKKEEENQRKQEEERQRQEAARNGHDPAQPPPPGQYGQPGMMAHHAQLPPIGYQPAGQGQYAQPQQVDGAPQYGGSQMYGQGYPQSPYAQGGLPYSGHQPPAQHYQQQ